MLYAMKLGPVEMEDGAHTLYLGFGDRGAASESATNDIDGLKLLARSAKEPLLCEPQLRDAAERLGLKVGELPPEPLAFKVAMAISLDTSSVKRTDSGDP